MWLCRWVVDYNLSKIVMASLYLPNDFRANPLVFKPKKTIISNTGSAGGSCWICKNLPTHVLKYHVNHCIEFRNIVKVA